VLRKNFFVCGWVLSVCFLGFVCCLDAFLGAVYLGFGWFLATFDVSYG